MSYTLQIPRETGRYGPYGGRYVPETLVAPLEELERAYLQARTDRLFLPPYLGTTQILS